MLFFAKFTITNFLNVLQMLALTHTMLDYDASQVAGQHDWQI